MPPQSENPGGDSDSRSHAMLPFLHTDGAGGADTTIRHVLSGP